MPALLYINLWGTGAKILEGSGSTEELEAYSQRFDRQLEKLCSHQAKRIGDYAYVQSDRADQLLDLACSLYRGLFFAGHEFRFWPLRASIVLGEINPETYAGPASVTAGLLEKSARKGCRLLISQSFAELLAKSDRTRVSDARGIIHHEINWMTQEFLNQIASDGRTVRAHFDWHISDLMETESNYHQQMGASLRDLISWTEKSVERVQVTSPTRQLESKSAE